jgi:hypothetical protein
MIRFIDLGNQISESATTDFAFFDTVVDKFVHLEDHYHWDSREEFIENYTYSGGWRENQVERFTRFIPDKNTLAKP